MSLLAWARRLKRALRPHPVERLRRLGLVVGRNFSMQPGVTIDESHAWHIEIGDDVTLAPRVIVLAHDASTKRALGYTRIGRVVIGHRVFVGAGAIVLPGVRIGDDAVVGAGAVVTHDVPPGTVVGGNPARVVMSGADYLDKRRRQLATGPVFSHAYTRAGGVTPAQQREMNEAMAEGIGFIE
jgi:maltose O-acetyltransferase